MINKNGLVMRLAVVVLFSAFAIGILSTQILSRLTYVSELEQSKKTIQQLYHTVSATTSIATYLEDQELAKEVISGLLRNDIVQGAEIVSDGINVATQGHVISDETSKFVLYSPFEQDNPIGDILITPNLDTIKARAEKLNSDNVTALSIQGIVAIIILMIVSHLLITKPIISIAETLHETEPGTSQRITIPPQHNQSELGALVVDINHLLTNAEQQIKNERNLRSEVEVLGKYFRLLFENSTSPIILTEPKGNIILYNHAFFELLKVIGAPFKSSFGPYLMELFEDQKLLKNTVDIAFGNNEIASGEFELVSEDKTSPIWMQVIISATVTEDYRELYQVTLHDISKRKKQLEKLNVKAKTDNLTMLLNRRGAEEQIQRLLVQKVPFALALIDLDGFKPVNDKYGHDAGDDILIHVAQSLTKGLRQRDVLSRWGGDEFIVVVPEANKVGMEHVAKKIVECVAMPYELNQHGQSINVSVGASVGIAFYPDDKVTMKALIECADKAMYQAKNNKYDQSVAPYSFYDSNEVVHHAQVPNKLDV